MANITINYSLRGNWLYIFAEGIMFKLLHIFCVEKSTLTLIRFTTANKPNSLPTKNF
jgi:hypothetical protein